MLSDNMRNGVTNFMVNGLKAPVFTFIIYCVSKLNVCGMCDKIMVCEIKKRKKIKQILNTQTRGIRRTWEVNKIQIFIQ